MQSIVGTYVPPVRTPVKPAEAVQGFRTACRVQWGADSPECVATLTAHSALESGRWSAMWNDNPSNVKHEPSRAGTYTCIPLNEVETRAGKRTIVWYDPTLGELVTPKGPARFPAVTYDLPPGHFQCRMRAYASFAEGVADKLGFLNRARYAAAKAAALAGDPALYVDRLAAAGYFTADREPYQRGVVSLFRTYLPIARELTAEPKALEPADEDQLCQDMARCLRVEPPEWLAERLRGLMAQVARIDWDEFTADRDRSVQGE